MFDEFNCYRILIDVLNWLKMSTSATPGTMSTSMPISGMATSSPVTAANSRQLTITNNESVSSDSDNEDVRRRVYKSRSRFDFLLSRSRCA